MNSHSNIKIGFIAIIILMTISGSVSFISMITLSAKTKQMYDHPFAVSNAARNINTDLISMHRYMKDVALAKDEEQLWVAIDKVNEHESGVLNNFEIIFDRFLGDKEQVQNAYQAFLDWETIRNEVISLMRSGETNKAALITKRKGAEHVERLNESTMILIDYATNKAEEFYSDTQREKTIYLILELTLIITVLLVSIYISVTVIRNFNSTDKKSKGYFHLIDQNIMIDTLDSNGISENLSNALCRFVGREKHDVTGKQNSFFLAEQNQTLLTSIRNTIRTGELWKGDYQIETSDGKIKWVNSSIHPVFDQNYDVIGFRNILLDISDRKKVENLSITDDLTKIFNRRHFDEIIKSQIDIQRRSNNYLTLAILDVDYFKTYNDNYGHPAGDKVLSTISDYMKKTLKRPNDFVFRLGGEEFAILFSDSDLQQSTYFINKIKDGIEELNIEHELSNVSDYVTVSIGAHVYKGSDIPSDEIFYAQTDEALYKAKEAGRNHVIIFSSKPLKLVEHT